MINVFVNSYTAAWEEMCCLSIPMSKLLSLDYRINQWLTYSSTLAPMYGHEEAGTEL